MMVDMDEIYEGRKWLTDHKMIAAELYGYSYAHYEDHLLNNRFSRNMPNDVRLMERAEREKWPMRRLAKALELTEEQAINFQKRYQDAKSIVEAPTLAESFRRAVRVSIQVALKEGLEDVASVERLVTQICYRAADLGFRLQMDGIVLDSLSEELREESEYDDAYWNEKMKEEMNQLMEE